MESVNSILKSCPFCGGKAVLFVENGVQVMCLECGARTQQNKDKMFRKAVSNELTVTDSVSKAIEDWNRRI